MINYRGLQIPKVSFGNIDSDALFGPLDQEVFDFYESNRDRYKTALDIGANIGVHSILMAKQGWQVRAFEPDVCHYWRLRVNLQKNGIKEPLEVDPIKKAISNRSGRATFVRVSNNTTGSHLEGEKTPYGPVERSEVEIVDCRIFWPWADFAKIDCEGHEATILECVTNKNCEFMVEVTNLRNAERIFGHFHELGMEMWAQKLGWGLVEGLGDMPAHHSQGHLFIGNHHP